MKKLYTKIFRNFAALLIVLLLVVIGVMGFYFTGVLTKNAQDSLESMLQYSGNELEKMETETALIRSLIQRSVQVQQAIREIPDNNYERYSQKLEINGFLHTLQAYNTFFVESFYIMMDDGRQFKSTNFPLLYESTGEMPEYEALRAGEEETWIGRYDTDLAVNNRRSGYVAVVHPLASIKTGRQVGIILEEISIGTLQSTLLSGRSGDGIFIRISDGDGRELLSLGEPKQGTGLFEVSQAKTIGTGWELFISTNIWTLVGDTLMGYLLLMGVLLVGSLLFAFFMSRRIASSVSAPINQLLQRMDDEKVLAQTGSSAIQTDIYEVQSLSKVYDRMIGRMKGLFEELEEKQKAVRRYEFAALQAQINPHFLYNTLDNITWKIRVDDKQEAIDEIMSLSRFFRLSLSRGSDMLTVEEELDHVRIYLSIQKKRYGRKFDYQIRSMMRTEEMQRCRVPKLILQPLAENAINHGFECVREGGMIDVTADRDADRIILTVQDNGQGMDNEKMERLNRLLAETSAETGYFEGHETGQGDGNQDSHMPADQSSAKTDAHLPSDQTSAKADAHLPADGYGIFNVNARIKMLFGAGYGLSFEKREGGGITARLVLPA